MLQFSFSSMKSAIASGDWQWLALPVGMLPGFGGSGSISRAMT